MQDNWRHIEGLKGNAANTFAEEAHPTISEEPVKPVKKTKKGKKMVKVDRFFPSSKKCCKCGRIKKELKLSERVYRCACGNEMDRDRNAAINIREEARRMLTA